MSTPGACIQCIDWLPLDVVEGQYKIKCPSCHVVTSLPQDGSTAGLPPAFHIHAMIELYETSEILLVKEHFSGYAKYPKHHCDMEMFCEE